MTPLKDKRQRKVYNEEYYRKLKAEVFSHYCKGNPKCNKCGNDELDDLTLRHINSNGKVQRFEDNIVGGTQTYGWAKIHGYPPIFEVLCRPCYYDLKLGYLLKRIEILEQGTRLEIHEKVQRLCDLWVSHIEAVDHQLDNPYYFQLARLTREEKDEFATILKDLLIDKSPMQFPKER